MRYKVGGPAMSHVAYNWARDLPMEGPRGKRSVLKSLGDHANEYWASWPSRKLIAKETDLSPRSVSNYLRDLVHDGVIVPVPWRNEEGGDAGSGYFLTGMPGAPNFAPISMAFKDRRYGFPRGRTPEWWSGEKRNSQAAVQDPLWGEGPTHRTPGSHPWEGEGPTGRTPGVPPIGPLEPSVEPPVEPSIKTSGKDHPAAASATAEAGTSRSEVLADGYATGPAAADAVAAANSTVIQMSDHRAARAAGRAVGEKPAAKPKKLTASQKRDAERRAQIEAMPMGRVTKVVTKYEKTYPKGCKWAAERAQADLGLAVIPEDGDDDWDEFLRCVFWWALKFHNRRQDWPEVLTRAFDEEAMAAEETVAAIRRQRVNLLTCEDGAEDDTLKRMFKAINTMAPTARAEMAAEIELRKPRVWSKCLASAQDQLERDNDEVDEADLTRLALQYVVQRYRHSKSKQWPSFVVPPSMRPNPVSRSSAA